MSVRKLLAILSTVLSAHFWIVKCQCPEIDDSHCSCSILNNEITVKCQNARSFYDILPALDPLKNLTVHNLKIFTVDILWLQPKVFDDFLIQKLHLNDNLLTSIAKDAFDANLVETLVTLDLKGNQIDKIHQSGLENLENLEELCLRKNYIQSLPVASFSRYKSNEKLVKLDLSHNLLDNSRILNGQGLADLPNLEELSLEANSLTSVPLAGLTEPQKMSLMYLNLGLNNIGQISASDLEFLNLRSLSLEYNNITLLRANAFKNLPNLQFLYLSGNHIVFINALLLINVQNLVVLGFSENPIQTLRKDTFRYTRKLQRLDLSRCRINFIENHAFSDVPGIEAIILNGNNLTSIGSDIFRGLTELQTLDLKHNAIRTIGISAFSSLPSLRHMDLSRNRIESLSAMVFQHTFLPKLQTMYLCGNPWKCNSSLMWLRRFMDFNTGISIDVPPVCTAQCTSTNETLRNN